MTVIDGILWVTAGLVLTGIVLVLIRAVLGPTVYDRILAVNAIGTKTVILVVLLTFIKRRAEFLDIALLYTLINFVATVAILKFKELGRLG